MSRSLCLCVVLALSPCFAAEPPVPLADEADDDLVALSDEFDDADTLGNWQIRHQVDGQPATYEALDIGNSRAGWLTIVPRPTAGWYRDQMGPLLFKTITGDFIASTYVIARNRNNPNQPPTQGFNSGGILARDPASRQGRQNWVVVNVGRQQRNTGTETKTTVNSDSTLFLEDGPAAGEVRMARLGSDFHLFRRLYGENEWRLIRTFQRPDLPATLQVGIMCNGWGNRPDLRAEYDWIRFARPAGRDDLTRELPPAGE